ncbi:MAG: hypothetical protein ACOC3G_08495 [Phycisphaeraceae bacterium]
MEAHRVTARGHIFGANKPELSEFDDLAIDSSEILVEFDGGHLLSMRVAWGLPSGFGMQGGEWLVGSEGHAQLVSKEIHLRTKAGREVVQPDPASGVCTNNLAEAIHGREQVAATGKDGLEALRVSLAALKSIEKDEPVLVADV